jgi:hypothetical protein
MLQNTLALQKKLYQRGSTSAYAVAQTASLLGNNQEAIQYLKLAYQNHDENVIQAGSDNSFETLHGEPAYKELITQLKLPAHD